MKRPETPKKKTFWMLDNVKAFMRNQPGEVKQELNGLIFQLERNGFLNYPNAEKIEGEDLFAIRVI